MRLAPSDQSQGSAVATAWAGWPASARSAPSLPADAGWTAATTHAASPGLLQI